MKDYHNRQTLREKLFRPLYRLPLMPLPIERFFAGKLMPWLIGEPDHSFHAGKNCPCMEEYK